MSRRPDHAFAPTMTPKDDPSPAGAARAKFSPRRLVPLIVIAVAAGVVIAMGWQRQLSFETLARHYEALRTFIAAHEVSALAAFVAATALGVIPATFAFAFVGAGLDSVIAAQQAAYQSCLAAARPDCRLEFHMKAALTPELLGALVALGVLALIPVVVKRLRARSTVHAREWTDNA